MAIKKSMEFEKFGTLARQEHVDSFGRNEIFTDPDTVSFRDFVGAGWGSVALSFYHRVRVLSPVAFN